MSSADVRFKDRQPRSHRWLSAFNLLAALAALASTAATHYTIGFPHGLESWLWTILFAFLPAVVAGGSAFFALSRLKGAAAALCCGLSGIAASGLWAHAYNEIARSGDPNTGLAMTLLPISLLPIWAAVIVVTVVLEWWSSRTALSTR